MEHSSKHRRNLAIVGGVTASVLVSPIVAGIAVGKSLFIPNLVFNVILPLPIPIQYILH